MSVSALERSLDNTIQLGSIYLFRVTHLYENSSPRGSFCQRNN